ncbi:hypothetical protein Vadar_005260 [Vaccinium darrowii]|uniref:Uncharacterized protein n=1 Tax=Vaccinium darrowii TaxID=229202 RepID=A0ACB7WYD3_9ERIC|nr:hypothetical protein Vadar_005260 [Vaccinium darrowii]
MFVAMNYQVGFFHATTAYGFVSAEKNANPPPWKKTVTGSLVSPLAAAKRGVAVGIHFVELRHSGVEETVQDSKTLELAEDHVLDKLFEHGYLDAAVWGKGNPVEEIIQTMDHTSRTML